MSGPGFQALQITLLLMLLSVVVAGLFARKLQTPYAILLVLGGLLFGFVPGMHRLILNPDIIFFVVLPPLLFSAAWNTAWRDFRHNLVTIALLAIGLVAFTVLSVALTGPLLLPGFTWQIGFVLGAVVATTDSVAATSIARKVGLPKRIVDVLEGESLANDGTGLLALEFGIAMVVGGHTPTIASGLLRLFYLSFVGIGVGILLAWIVEWFELRIDDAPIEIAISIFVPYAAYLAGSLLDASGVLAVVAAGLYLGGKSSRFFSPIVRLQANAVWNALTFILNGLVFITIGLQLPYVLQQIQGFPRTRLFVYGVLFSAFLIILRLVWTFPGAAVSYFVRTRLLHQDEAWPGNRRIFVVGWTGMRGVIALAAAISLPHRLANGDDFPQRSLIIFLTFCVILITLVVQGLTLPALVRALGIGGDENPERDKGDARRTIIEAALEHLAGIQDDSPEFAEIGGDISHHYQQRLASLHPEQDGPARKRSQVHARYLEISRELLQVERETARRLQKEARISAEALRELERDLDLSAIRLDHDRYA